MKVSVRFEIDFDEKMIREALCDFAADDLIAVLNGEPLSPAAETTPEELLKYRARAAILGKRNHGLDLGVVRMMEILWR